MNISKWAIVCCLAAVFLAGCGAKRTIRVEDRLPHPAGPALESGQLEQRLRAEASRWRGTPHRLGGNDLGGVDCSGLVQQIYRNLFDLEMPRTARRQAARGVRIGRNDLEPGDLVFFRPPGKKDHVGIYLGRGEFVHTSAKRGVMISRMDLSYWRKYYWTARRIIR